MHLIPFFGGIIMPAKVSNIQPRAVIDSAAVHFPLFSYYERPKIKTANGVKFWQYFGHWYTTFELSRYDLNGTYTPYLPETPAPCAKQHQYTDLQKRKIGDKQYLSRLSGRHIPAG